MWWPIITLGMMTLVPQDFFINTIYEFDLSSTIINTIYPPMLKRYIFLESTT